MAKTNSEAGDSSPLKRQLDDFIHSLGDTLVDFTALEVNTMVVNQIQGSDFDPLDAYSKLYAIGNQPKFLERFPEDLRPRYLKLWQRLEKKYKLCFPERSASILSQVLRKLTRLKRYFVIIFFYEACAKLLKWVMPSRVAKKLIPTQI